jgi:hypothetical protein
MKTGSKLEKKMEINMHMNRQAHSCKLAHAHAYTTHTW